MLQQKSLFVTFFWVNTWDSGDFNVALQRNLVADGDLYEFTLSRQVDHLNGLQAVATTLVSGELGVG